MSGLGTLQPLQDPDLGVDLHHHLHLVYSAGTGLGQQVRYMRWGPDHGWDAYPTSISDPSQGSAGRMAILPFTPGNVSILYTSYTGGATREHARVRALDSPLTLDVPTHVTLGPNFRIGPNPLFAGSELRATGPALVNADAMDLFDASGRRVATARVSGGAANFSRAATGALGPGLYFARVRGGAASRVVVLR